MKIVVKIMNLIYIVLAAIACTALLTKPIVQINAAVALPKEQVTELIYPQLQDQIKRDDWDNAIDHSLDENGNLTISLDLSISSAATFKKDPAQVTTDLTDQIAKTVDELVTKLKPAIKELAKSVALNAAHDAIKDNIAEQIKNSNPDSDAAQIMEEVGIDDEYIDNMTSDVYDWLLGNPDEGVEPVKTVDELMEKVEGEYITDVCGKLADAGVAGFSTDPEERAAQIAEMSGTIEAQLQDSLSQFGLCDEEGNINNIDNAIDEFLANMIDQLLGGGSSSGEEGKTSEEATPVEGEPTVEGEPKAEKVLRVSREAVEGEEEESKLTAKIREILNQKIAEFKLEDYIAQYSWVPIVLALVLIFPWAVFVVITLIRTIRRRKVWTKSWVVFTLAFIQLILGIVLYLATSKFMGKLLELLPDMNNPYVDMLKYSTLSVKTGTFLPSIIYLAMIPFTIVYIILCHKVKKQYKADKRAKKEKQENRMAA